MSIHALYKWFPDQKRNLPVSIITQGAALGLLLAGLLIPLITREWGWRANFVILGAIGGVWSVLWLYFGREGTLGVRPAAAGARGDLQAGVPGAERLPYRTILTDPSVLSTFFLGFAVYWMLGQNLTWLPTYLEKGLGFSSVEAGRWFAVVTEVAAPVNIGLSWLSQRLLQRGASTRQARAQFVCLMMLVGAALFLVLPMLNLPPVQRVLLFTLAGALPTLCFTLAPALLAEVVPASQRGAIVSIHTAVASFGAAIAPVVMGRIVQTHGSVGSQAYEMGFVTGAVLLIVAALTGLRWLHPERSNRALNGSRAPATA